MDQNTLFSSQKSIYLTIVVEGDRGGVIFSLLGNKDILTGVSPWGYMEGGLEDLVGVSHGGDLLAAVSPWLSRES